MENKKVLEFGEIAYLRKEKFNPQKDITSKKCIELEHLSQETGQLLGYVDSQEQKSTKNVFCENDVLFGKLRPYLKKFWFAEFEGVCSSEIWVLRAKKEICVQKYLYYLVQTHKFNQVANVSSGSKMPRADWKFIINSPFSIINSKTEQTKIANFLSLVDKKIENVKLIIENLKLYKRGLMQQIFSQKLRFKPVPSDSEGAKNGQNFPDWEDKRLGEVGEITGGGTPDTTKADYWNGDINWFTPTEIKQKYVESSLRKITDAGVKNSSARILLKGTILITSRATVGDIAISKTDFTTNQGFQSVNVNDNHDTEFVYYLLLTKKKDIIRKGNGTTFLEVSKNEFKKLKIQLPSLPEQKKIADFLSALDRKIENEEKKLEHLKEWKKGLLQKMFV